MAVHNGMRFLPVQVASLLADLQSDDEVVVIDDGSSDESVAWFSALQDPRVRVHKNPTNLGVRASFERGLTLASNEIIFLCDQDDVWLAGKRGAFVDAFERDRSALVVLSDAEIIDGEGLRSESSFMRTRGGFQSGFWSNVIRNRYLGCSMAVRRPLIALALPIPSYVPMHDMWIGMLGALRGRVVYLEKPYIQYRRHGSNVSPSRRQPWSRVLVWRVQILTAIATRIWLGADRALSTSECGRRSGR
jgi:glycosyltransferase involved in cell wall biosynthesis